MKPTAHNYIPALTGVRFLAAFFVFLFHYRPFRGSGNPVLEAFSHMSYQMFTGVGLFFVLSGFLICYTYYSSAKLENGFLKNYFVRRIARIFPVFFLLTTAYFIYWAFQGRNSWNDLGIYFMNITLLKGFFPSIMYTGILQAWTLTIEETFYLLAPLIFILHRLYKLFLGQALVLFGVGLLFIIGFYYAVEGSLFRGLNFFFMATFFGRCFEFFVGMQLAFMLLRSPVTEKPQAARFPLATMLGSISIVIYLFLMSRWHIALQASNPVKYAGQILGNNIVFPLIVAIFFYGLIYERSWVQRFFAWKPVELLGKSSYAFYLIHIGLIGHTVHALTNRILLTFLLLQAIAILIFLLVERPLYKLITSRHCTVGKKNIILAAS